jgi:hypothetical protein
MFFCAVAYVLAIWPILSVFASSSEFLLKASCHQAAVDLVRWCVLTAHPTAAIYSDGGFDADGHQVKYNCISTCPIREKFDAGSEVIGQLEKGEEVYVLEVKDHDHFRIDRGESRVLSSKAPTAQDRRRRTASTAVGSAL